VLLPAVWILRSERPKSLDPVVGNGDILFIDHSQLFPESVLSKLILVEMIGQLGPDVREESYDQEKDDQGINGKGPSAFLIIRAKHRKKAACHPGSRDNTKEEKAQQRIHKEQPDCFWIKLFHMTILY
jgi:hypothetical protein